MTKIMNGQSTTTKTTRSDNNNERCEGVEVRILHVRKVQNSCISNKENKVRGGSYSQQ